MWALVPLTTVLACLKSCVLLVNSHNKFVHLDVSSTIIGWGLRLHGCPFTYPYNPLATLHRLSKCDFPHSLDPTPVAPGQEPHPQDPSPVAPGQEPHPQDPPPVAPGQEPHPQDPPPVAPGQEPHSPQDPPPVAPGQEPHSPQDPPPVAPGQEPHSPASTADRGVTLSVLNQRDGFLIFHKVFPVWEYWAHWADLEWHLARVSPGRLVVMAVSASGTVGLRGAARRLTQLGSLFAQHLPPTARWTWVFVKGGRTISETAILRGSASQHVHLLLPLSDMIIPGNISQVDQKRWEYCTHHGTMGGLCDEISPDPLTIPTPLSLPNQDALAEVPIIVTGGRRHQYLYHALSALLAAPGACRYNLLVVLGDAPDATTQLLHLMNISFTTLPVYGHANNKLFRYYQGVFRLIADRFPNAPAVILLDEDIEVSPDFFAFMSQTLWLLKSDPSLYCINAFSAGGFQGLAYDNRRVLRGSVQVEWGYGITIDFVREALAAWERMTIPNTLLYDFWLYMNLRKGRECVFPEVSRTLHFGMGVNTNAFLKEKGPLMMPLVKQGPILLHEVWRLQLSTWIEDLTRNISAATLLTGNPCSDTFLPKSLSAFTLYVFYYRLDFLKDGDELPDSYQLFHVAECLGMWSMSEQGHHRGVHIVRFSSSATLYLVGVPFSQYSHLRPNTIPLWDAYTISDRQFELMGNYTQERYSRKIIIANEYLTSDVLLEMLSTPS